MLMVSPTADDYIYIGLGLIFGYLIGMNRKAEKDTKTLEEVDIELRKDLEYHKNLNESLQEDLTYTKNLLKEERNKK